MFMTGAAFGPTDVPFLILGLYFIITSWIDIKSHEVPDWLTYSLTALGILFAAARTLLFWRGDLPFLEQDLMLIWSIAGAAIGLGLGALLYYTGQWGGGDAKLLMGTGAILGINLNWFVDVARGQFMPMPAFVWFLAFVLVCGAIYGVIWMLALIALKPKQFWPPYRLALKNTSWQRWALAATLVLIGAATVYVWQRSGFGYAAPLLGLALLVVAASFLSIAVQTVETALMRKKVKPAALVEGDWVIGGLTVGKKKIIPTGTVSVSKEQITLAQRLAPSATLTVKHGIPFVPSFLFAYVVLIILAYQ